MNSFTPVAAATASRLNNNNNNNNNTRTTLNRFPTKNCHTRNITHRKESATS
jgi:hypothetical protein